LILVILKKTSTDELKAFVFTEPITVGLSTSITDSLQLQPSKTINSKTANKSVVKKSTLLGKDEIYIDINEDISFVFNQNGQILRSEIEGRLLLRSFLKGVSTLKLGLNDNIMIGRNRNTPSYGVLNLDYCKFHDSVDLSDWEIDRGLIFNPPEGEFDLMRYKISSEMPPPFKIFTRMEEPGQNQIDVYIRVISEFPQVIFASKFVVKCPVPLACLTASCDYNRSGQTAEFNQKDSVVVWTIKKITGQSEQSIRIKLNLQNTSGNYKKEIGPISLSFEIPMFLCSNFGIQYLRIADINSTTIPYKWVRSLTKSSSYIIRTDSNQSQTQNYDLY